MLQLALALRPLTQVTPVEIPTRTLPNPSKTVREWHLHQAAVGPEAFAAAAAAVPKAAGIAQCSIFAI